MDNTELKSWMQGFVEAKNTEEKGLREELLAKVIQEPDNRVAENMLDRYNKFTERDASNAIASGVISVLSDDILDKVVDEVRNRHENGYQKLTPEGVMEFILEDRCKDKGIQRNSMDTSIIRSRDVDAYDSKPSRFEYRVSPIEPKSENKSINQQMSYAM